MKKYLLLVILIISALVSFANPFTPEQIKEMLGYDIESDMGFRKYYSENISRNNNKLNADEKGNNVEGWTIRVDAMFADRIFPKYTTADFAAIPSSYNLFNEGFSTPIRNQDGHGLCWTFGAAGAMESAILKQWENFSKKYPEMIKSGLISRDDTLNLSEQFLAFHNGQFSYDYNYLAEDHTIRGGWGYYVMFNLIRFGIPLEGDFPYIGNGTQNNFQYKKGPKEVIFNAQNNEWQNHILKPDKIAYIGNNEDAATKGIHSDYAERINTIKKALMTYGAMEVSYIVPADFDKSVAAWGGLYFPQTTKPAVDGGHAVTLVGWKDITVDATMNAFLDKTPGLRDVSGIATGTEKIPCWIVKNSWSETWGENGYFYMPMVTKSTWDEYVATTKVNPSFSRYTTGAKEFWKIDLDWMMVPVFEKINIKKCDFNNDGDINDADYELLMAVLTKTLSGTALTEEEIKKFDISTISDKEVNVEDYFEFVKIWNMDNGL